MVDVDAQVGAHAQRVHALVFNRPRILAAVLTRGVFTEADDLVRVCKVGGKSMELVQVRGAFRGRASRRETTHSGSSL